MHARLKFTGSMVSATLLLAVLSACTEVPAPPVNVRSAAVAALFEHYDKGVQPGAAVLVIKDGAVVFERGFGYADIANKVHIDADSMFRLASVSKQFTTMAIMVLAEAGKLSYDDLLSQHVPELNSWPGVTIRHLMTHTSGVPDYYDAGYYAAYDPSGPMVQNDELIEIMLQYPEPDFPPGDDHVYNNGAYELLTTVVARISGMSFADFVTQHVLAAAGMPTATPFRSATPDIPKRVYGYKQTDEAYELDDYDAFNAMLGAGSIYATLKDFYAWDQSLYGNTVVTGATLNEAYTRTRLNNGKIIDYGFGWRINEHKGHLRIAHGGSWVGFRTNISRFPEENLTIVVLTNRREATPGAYAEKIADIYLRDRGNSYLPDESQASVMRHHREIPDDDIWWTVTGPEMGWMHRHVEQLFPTVAVYRNGPVRELDYELNDDIGKVQIDTPDGPLSFNRFIHSDHSTAMGIVILHQGKIVFESYPRMQEYEHPTYWSTAKVFAGAIVRLLEERGEIDVSRPIDYYVPRLADSVFAGTTVRNVLDMALGVDCTEEYIDRESCYYQYSMAIGDGFRSADAPDNPYDFMATVEIERTGPQGEKFVYSGGTNFLLMWLVEEVTGYPFQDSVTKEFWYHIGAENDAAFLAYRYGIAVSHGGLLAKTRDLARFGLLYTPSYTVVSDKQIISDAHIDLLLNGGRPHLLRNAGVPEDSRIKHNVYQWGNVDVNNYVSQGGWGGQGLVVNPEKDVVAVFTSYFKDDYSEVSLQDAVMKVLNETFNDPE
ncbi:MAG: beta-lactamase family protein [Proteobacteria bacterium]|nr:beta-lactamase family protein [Pseudomonadota bacterium]